MGAGKRKVRNLLGEVRNKGCRRRGLGRQL